MTTISVLVGVAVGLSMVALAALAYYYRRRNALLTGKVLGAYRYSVQRWQRASRTAQADPGTSQFAEQCYGAAKELAWVIREVGLGDYVADDLFYRSEVLED